ncbi:MAG: hypothetical protein GY867_00120 [bacterium]|nr:hypothetical protein [bacterium]
MQEPITIRDTGIKVTDVLRCISLGLSYQQILDTHPKLILGDIMSTARLAQDFIEQYVTSEGAISLDHVIEIRANSGRIINVSKIREEYPRAYEPWKPNEEAELVEMHKKGMSVLKIAEALKRQPGAVSSRLRTRGLLGGKPEG